MEAEKTKITVELPLALYERLRAAAAEQMMSMGAIVRQALAARLAETRRPEGE